LNTETDYVRVAARTLVLLRELRTILEREGGRNWLPGVTAAIDALAEPVASTPSEAHDGLRAAGSIYRSMHRGPGSFGDFYVQRADPAEQARANERYAAIADELWTLLEPVR
jgi:hypothetical protein